MRLCVYDSSETVGEGAAARDGVFVGDLHYGGSVGSRSLTFLGESKQFEVGDAPWVGFEDSAVVELNKLVALWEWGATSVRHWWCIGGAAVGCVARRPRSHRVLGGVSYPL